MKKSESAAIELKIKISSAKDELKTPQQAKTLATASLLMNIGKINLVGVCKELGWIEGSDGKPPLQKHFKVAIVHTLIDTAKKYGSTQRQAAFVLAIERIADAIRSRK